MIFGRPFVKRFAACYQAVVCLSCLSVMSCLSCQSCLSVTFVHCGQTVGRIKMPLGMEVGLGIRNIVFDVDLASLIKKGHTHSHPICGPCLLWPNGRMDENAAWYGSRPRLRPHCSRRGPSSRERGTAPPPLFSAHIYCDHGRPSQLLLNSC